MTYANAKKLFTFHRECDDTKILSYLLEKILHRSSIPNIILIIGKYSYSTGAYLASVLGRSTYKTSRCSEYYAFEPYEMFSINGKHIDSGVMCNYIENIVSIISDKFPEVVKGRDFIKRIPLSERSAALVLSLLFSSDEKCDFIIFECESNDLFERTISKYIPSPLLTILTDTEDDRLLKSIPDNTAECVCYSRENNYDYISNIFTKSGTHMNFVANNKIVISKTTSSGTDLFYNSQMLNTNIIDRKFILSAAFALESAKTLDHRSIPIPTSCIFRGMREMKNPFDFVFYSHYPTIVCKAIGNCDTKESINDSLSELQKILTGDLKLFYIHYPTDKFELKIDCFNYDDDTYLRKNISEFIRSNMKDILVFIGNINIISTIKKELELIPFLHRRA